MKFLRNAPIQRKVLAVTLLVAAVGLVLTGGGLFAFQVYSFQNHFPREVEADGSIIASYSVGPVVLNYPDPAAATEMLGALKAKPYISEAQLRLPDGSLFARSGRDPRWNPSAGMGRRREGPYLVYSEQLMLDHELIGTLHLRADYRAELFALVRVYVLVLGLVLTVSIVLTALLSARLQRVISEPILSLAKTAKAIAKKRDYSVRAEKLEEDEIGQFTDAFNDMLAEIQDRDSALRHSRQKLETLINTIEGVVWEADPKTLRFGFVSAQSARLLGLSAAEWIAGDNFWSQYIHEADREHVMTELRQAMAARKPCTQEYRLRIPGREIIWVRSYANIILEEDEPVLMRGVMLDITREKKAAEELASLHAELLQTSRHAGMAEVATGVLHNVGNVLNSMNVSATIVRERIRKSEVGALSQVSALLRQHQNDIADFFAHDPKGRLVPDFIHRLSTRLQDEHAETLGELESLAKNVEHINNIVAMQQGYARIAAFIESLSAADLITDALQINAAEFQRHDVEVTRSIEEVPRVAADRHKVLQILINLLSNARYAIDENGTENRLIVISVARRGHDAIQIIVKDTGIGIPPENLTKIFSHGFTTKKNGHGFGLHSSAIAATQMGGSLSAHSDGPGAGASFTLELPIARETDS